MRYFWFTHLGEWRYWYSTGEKLKEGQIRGRRIRRSVLDLFLKCPGNIQVERCPAGSWGAQGDVWVLERDLDSSLLCNPSGQCSILFLLHKCSWKYSVNHCDLLIARSRGRFSVSSSSAFVAFDTVGYTVLETHHVASMTPRSWFSLCLWLLCQLLYPV